MMVLTSLASECTEPPSVLQLDSGIAGAYSGASTISAGLSTASSKSAALRKGAQDITNSILETVNAQLAAAGQATYTGIHRPAY